jgi:hypothetical protein
VLLFDVPALSPPVITPCPPAWPDATIESRPYARGEALCC